MRTERKPCEAGELMTRSDYPFRPIVPLSGVVFRCVILALVLLVATLRGWFLFSTPLIPGINGAYYLIQARALCERMTLAIPDLPLIFTLQAFVAKAIHLFTAQDLDQSTVFAVKICDSILPALAVIPVMLLGKAWSRSGSNVDLCLAACASLLITVGGPALLMLGEFQKNSFAITLLCAFAWALTKWMSSTEHSYAVLALTSGSLIGMTHIGIFGTTLLFAASVLTLFFMMQGTLKKAALTRFLIAAALLILLISCVVYWWFDPVRINRLVNAATGHSPIFTFKFGIQSFSFKNAYGLQTITFLAISFTAVIACWWQRKQLESHCTAMISGAAITVLCLTGPWVAPDYLLRLQLNAIPLAILCLLFVLLSIPQRVWRTITGICLFGPLLAFSAASASAGTKPVISTKTYAELKSLTPRIKAPTQTLVVAPHGLEWWAAWALHTHVAQASALTAETWLKYREVWFLEGKSRMSDRIQLPIQTARNQGFLRLLNQASHELGGSIQPTFFRVGDLSHELSSEDFRLIHDGPNLRLSQIPKPPRRLPVP